MKRATKIALHAVIICILTALSQVGGIAYLAALGLRAMLRTQRKAVVTSAIAVALYGALTVWIVPSVAPLSGRVRIPCDMTTLMSCALNRNYARPNVVDLIAALNKDLARHYPGSRATILDANFPFLDGFPLPPHLSHDDGSKIDLAFLYRDRPTGKPIPFGALSPIGYFHFEQPQTSSAERCVGRSSPLRWNFAWAQPDPAAWILDEERTRFMILWLKQRSEVAKILLEPHLAERLHVGGGKVRFQGCWAARHDDHFHVELR